jgi:hypothetical protein
VCDPGVTAKGPDAGRLTKSATLLELRGEITAELAESGAPGDAARCVARLFVRRDEIAAPFLANPDSQPTAAQEAAIEHAIAADSGVCRQDPNVGLS